MELTKDIITDIVLDSDIVIPTSSFRHRHSDIVIPASSFLHRHSDIVIPTSSFRHRHSDIVIPTSSFRHRHSDIVIPTSSFRHRHSDINAVTDAVFCSSMAKDPCRGRDKVQKNLRARRNLIRTQFGPSPTQQSPTHHRPRRLIEEAREDEATMSFIKPDDSVLLIRHKGRCMVTILRGEVYDI